MEPPRPSAPPPPPPVPRWVPEPPRAMHAYVAPHEVDDFMRTRDVQQDTAQTPVAAQAPQPQTKMRQSKQPSPSQSPETFWDRWGTIVMLLCSIAVLAALGWFGYTTYQFTQRIQNGEQIDLSQFGGTDTASTVNTGQGNASFAAVQAAIENSSDDPTFGKADADITIVMFEDFECPFCGQAFPTLQQVMTKYAGKVKFVYRDFPLSSIHPNAQKAAEAAQCAHTQGKFWEYHDMLFTHQNALAVENLKSYAAQLGLDTQDFNRCVDTGEFADEVDKDFSDGLKAGVAGTPTFFINGNKVQGVVTEQGFDQIIQYFEQNVVKK